jgi:hypothetical protein
MSINFPCPKCGHTLAAPERLAGHKAKCRCGELVVVPTIELQELPLEVPAPPPGPAPMPDQTPSIESTEATESESKIAAKLSELMEMLSILRPGLLSATRVMVVALLVAVPLLVGGLYLLRMALAGIMDLTGGAANPVYFFRVFAILAGVFGVTFGVASSYVLTNKSGLVGWPAWTVSMAGTLILMVCGSLAAGVMFPQGTPQTVGFCLFAVGFMSMLGISFFTLFVS